MKYFSTFLIFGLFFSCVQKAQPSSSETTENQTEQLSDSTTIVMKTDIQGHRGCRGLLPENSLPAFEKALNMGITTLELDVVITKDKKVVISHEPWLSHLICKDAEGNDITEAKEKSHNIYEMNYEDLKKCDCGSRKHPRFPNQKLTPVHKPLLSELIELVQKRENAKQVWYNIEIKRKPEYDEKFCPKVNEFVDLVLKVLKKYGIEQQCNLQSFDWEVLRLIHLKKPTLPLAMLVENEKTVEQNLAELGIVPQIYSCYYKLLDEEVIQAIRDRNMQVIPWTVNEEKDIRQLIDWKVDGIITDYPDRVLAAKPQD